MLGLNDKILKLMDRGLPEYLVGLAQTNILKFIRCTHSLIALGVCNMVRYIMLFYI
jgi:hypothetical protein